MTYVSVGEIAGILGLPKAKSQTPMSLMSLIERGFRVDVLDHVAEAMFPADSAFRMQIVPRSTLARLKKSEEARLSADISNTLYRVSRVWALAQEVWGNGDNARAFMERPHPLLEGRTPKDVMISTELGAHLVEEILGRLQHGSAA